MLGFWPENSALAACYRRVALLREAGYLEVTRLPSLTGQGSGKALLMVGPAARRLLADQQGIPLTQMPRQVPAQSLLFLQHSLAITDFHLALELAADDVPGLELTEWVSETALRHAPIKVIDRPESGRGQIQTITLIPDGVFTLSYSGAEQRGQLELDMGTIAPRRLQFKLRGYLLHARDSNAVAPIFFVTTTPARADQILALATDEAKKIHGDATIVFVTTRQQINRHTVLSAPIWRQASVPGLHVVIGHRPVNGTDDRYCGIHEERFVHSSTDAAVGADVFVAGRKRA